MRLRSLENERGLQLTLEYCKSFGNDCDVDIKSSYWQNKPINFLLLIFSNILEDQLLIYTNQNVDWKRKMDWSVDEIAKSAQGYS